MQLPWWERGRIIESSSGHGGRRLYRLSSSWYLFPPSFFCACTRSYPFKIPRYGGGVGLPIIAPHFMSPLSLALVHNSSGWKYDHNLSQSPLHSWRCTRVQFECNPNISQLAIQPVNSPAIRPLMPHVLRHVPPQSLLVSVTGITNRSAVTKCVCGQL